MEKIGEKMKSKLSQGPDGISSKVLKHIIPAISLPLAHLINRSFETGTVPARIKESNIIPIYKSEDPMEINNHRPISLINTISKIYEKIVHKQLYKYLEQQSILNKRQYGFRNNSSCEHAMLDLLNSLEECNANAELANLIFIDLSKAFDTISHDILISKLEHYGLQDLAINWIQNYLSNRKHRTKYKNTLSDNLELKIGVPQGSILGPLLFLIYINDISDNIKGTFLYADDTTLMTKHRDEATLVNEANNKLEIAKDWFAANKLTLNAKKTRTMTISPSGKQFNQDIKLDNTVVQRISKNSEEKYFKFLGFKLEEDLKWETHSKDVLNKLNTANYIMAATKNKLPTEIKKLIYFGMAQAHLEYGIPIWFNKKFEKNAIKIQKKIIRNITNKKYNAHTSPLLYELNLLKPQELFEVASCRAIKKAMINAAPVRIREIFQTNTSTGRPLRFPNNMKLDYNNQGKRIGYEMKKLWNNLPEELKNDNTSIKQFTKICKEMHLKKYKNYICTNSNCYACSN